LAKYNVMLSCSNDFTGNTVASLTNSRPAGITAVGLWENSNGRNVPGRTEPPDSALPIDAPASRSGVSPYTLDSRIRTLVPPALIRTTWRTDWSVNPPGAHVSPIHGSACIGCMPVDQVPTQFPCADAVPALAGTAAASRIARTARRRFTDVMGIRFTSTTLEKNRELGQD
jgi:hypothetical protein